MINRITIIILDSLGVGEMPDAMDYDDAGANTLGHILDNYELNIPNMRRIGFGNIDHAAEGRLKVDNPRGSFGRFCEKSKGKDTITGHWEIAGLHTKQPFKTYPNGFPDKFLDMFTEKIGRGYIGNYKASGVEIIDKLGEEHEKSGKIIIYTSADSVFQVAANIDVVPLSELYDICQTARDMLHGEFACGRVIARPYVIKDGMRVRTSDRKDYSVTPPEKTMLDIIKETGKTVYAIGKISDIFNGNGISTSVHIENNDDGVTKTIDALNQDFKGLIFTNLVDFDSKYGHRRDTIGYAKAIEAFDQRLPEIIDKMRDDDVIILSSDHGGDPTFKGWDHTREHIFGVFYGDKIKEGINIGTRSTFADIGATVTDILTDGKKTRVGESFKDIIIK